MQFTAKRGDFMLCVKKLSNICLTTTFFPLPSISSCPEPAGLSTLGQANCTTKDKS